MMTERDAYRQADMDCWGLTPQQRQDYYRRVSAYWGRRSAEYGRLAERYGQLARRLLVVAIACWVLTALLLVL